MCDKVHFTEELRDQDMNFDLNKYLKYQILHRITFKIPNNKSLKW